MEDFEPLPVEVLPLAGKLCRDAEPDCPRDAEPDCASESPTTTIQSQLRWQTAGLGNSFSWQTQMTELKE